MTSTTGGNLFGYAYEEYEPDDMPTRSIPVGELLRREGHASVARAFNRRRGVLTGVAAGAVLAIGAAVGSLLIGHSDGNPNALASGASGSGAQVPNDGTGAITTTTGPASSQQATPNVAPMAQVTTQTQPTHPATHSRPTGTASTSTAPSTGTQSQTTAPSTGSSTTTQPTSPTTGTPSTGSTNTPPSTTTPPTTTTPPSSGNNGGLLGGVVGTVTGTVGSLTQPVFNWFG